MTIRVAKDQLFVEVSEGRTMLMRRGYDEAFFQSQRVDEFKVTATTGDGAAGADTGAPTDPAASPSARPPRMTAAGPDRNSASAAALKQRRQLV